MRDELNPALSLLGVVVSQVPTQATRLRRELRETVAHHHPNLHIFDAEVRASARSAFDSRRLGVVAAEYEAKAKRRSTARLAALGRSDPDVGRARSKAAAGLADDHHALACEIVARLNTVNAQLEALDAEDSARAPMPAPPPRAEGTKRSVSVSIEPDLFDAFDSWRSETERSFADCVLSAHLTHGEEIVERLHAEYDHVRAAHGLPQLRRQLEPGETRTMWITREGLDELNAAARSVRMTRQAYTHELLRVALRDNTRKE